MRHLISAACALSLLAALGTGPAAGATADKLRLGQPVLLSADEVVYTAGAPAGDQGAGDQEAGDQGSVTAIGNVELAQSGRHLLADRIDYDRDAGRVRATGNVVLIDETGNAVFADELELTDDLKDGFIERVSLLLTDDSRLAAARGTRKDGTITTLDEAVYSPCEICADGSAPLWQIRAKRVVHDDTAHTVTYRDATFEVFGVPVGYTPYFYHPDPTVEKQTGFLAPTVGSDTELGLTLEAPFFIDLAPNRDITLTPMITSKEGGQLTGELRDLEPWGQTTLAGSVAYTTDYQRTAQDAQGNALRGHVKGTGSYTDGDNRRLGFDLSLASDNTYLQRYGISNEDVLQNRVYLEQYDGRDFISLDGYAFQGLREDDDQGLIPIALPFATAHVTSERGQFGSFFLADANVLALTRTEGLDVRRLSTSAGWQLPLVGRIGELVRLSTSLRGDVYSVNGDPRDPSAAGSSDTVARLVPQATLDVSWPLIGSTENWQHIIEPVVSASWIGNNANDEDIPNEDSLVFEFDETNLFEPDRFTGLDRVETGAKVSYGLRFNSLGPQAMHVGGVFGQSYRNGPDKTLPEGSGLDNALSDYVGRLDFRPGPLLDFSYRFRLAKDELSFRRSDFSMHFGPPRMRFNLQYLELSESLPQSGINKRQEVVAGVRLQVVDSLAVGAQFRRDLTLDQQVTNSYGLLYTNRCLVVLAGLEQNFTKKGELKDETRFSLRFTLRSLGDVNAPKLLF